MKWRWIIDWLVKLFQLTNALFNWRKMCYVYGFCLPHHVPADMSAISCTFQLIWFWSQLFLTIFDAICKSETTNCLRVFVQKKLSTRFKNNLICLKLLFESQSTFFKIMPVINRVYHVTDIECSEHYIDYLNRSQYFRVT